MISIIVPVYNEEGNIKEFYKAIIKIITGLKKPYELIFIDDGSTDSSSDILSAIQQSDSNIKIITLSRNYGHQAAITAGMDFAKGDAVITMDADVQHPPELIPILIRKWEEGYDVVYTIRQQNKKVNIIKKITSKGFYKVINWFSDINISSGSADFRLLDKKVVNNLKNFKERVRFIRGLVSYVGYRQISIPYSANVRFAGKSKYSFKKMLKFALDGITSFSSIPLYISAIAGFIISGLSFLYALYAIYATLFTNKTIKGWASVLVAVLFLGGIQLIVLGIIGGYLGRIYIETKERPLYLVKETMGFDNG